VRLVLDWDGTVTERDTLELVVGWFGDGATYRRNGQLMGASLTHDQAQAGSFATVRASLPEVVDRLLRYVRIRPGFRELVERHRPLVISSGFHELIEPFLAREGVTVELLANHLDPRPEGWRIRFRDRSVCPACGEPCKRSSLPQGDVVYAGDGYSDRCAALAATQVFATGALADWLHGRGVSFERFETFYDVLAALDGRRAMSPARDGPRPRAERADEDDVGGSRA
jgi:2-hydroxy-3-keto-5-methylthiopentenyl-1-phosphate phosphatase